MTIPIFSEIEKLINEHGSAVILKERIELLKEQYSALERKYAESESNGSKNAAALRTLELSNFELKQKIKELEQAKGNSDSQRLESAKESLLVFLASITGYISTDDIARTLTISGQAALYHLTEMENAKLIHGSYTADGKPPEWKIIQGGRAYLVKHGMLT